MQGYDTLRRRLAAGKASVGAVARVPTPTLVEVYGDVGLDFVLLDYEHAGGHSPTDSATMENLVRAAELTGIDPVVRLPDPHPPLVRKVLETGVRTLLVPRIETAGEVREAVAATRFAFDGGVGDRGIAGTRANRWGGAYEGYLEREDAATTLGVMLETAAAVDDLDDVLAVPDLGFVFVGHRDLTHSLGHGEAVDDEEVTETVAAIRDACLDAGVPVGRVAADVDDARAAVDEGYRIVLGGYEFDAVRRVYGDWAAVTDE
ncbi:HpcH/HpaI aldolase family protein [Halomarina pelagica]|uniref:HpcH/HpaI aldolase family protein n=1 Tax=Halomarina pelagica TaxID=2961599 RepID=UPI0020C37A18|nr:aldolase/citrate lyase family protein [Halomarina sp. BND7]